MKTITFKNFRRWESGRVITSLPTLAIDENGKEYWTADAVVFKRNPYGKHNLVLVSEGEAIRHGNQAVLDEIEISLIRGNWDPAKAKRREKARRKALRFLAERRK